jgi:hypothetical protein
MYFVNERGQSRAVWASNEPLSFVSEYMYVVEKKAKLLISQLWKFQWIRIKLSIISA